MSWNSLGILPIEIWISKWCNPFCGEDIQIRSNKCENTRCWVFVKWTFNLHKAYFRHLQVYFALMPPDFIPQTKSTTYVKKNRRFVSCHIYYPMIAHHPSFPNHEWDLMAGWQQTNKKGVMLRLSLYTLEWYMYPNIPQPPLGWFWCFGNMPSSFSANSMGSAVGSFATSPTNFRKFCPAPWLCLRRGLGGLIIDWSSGCQCCVFLHIYVDWVSALEVSPMSRCLVSGLDTWNQMKANLFMRNCCREVIIWQWTAQFDTADSSCKS